MVFGVQGDMLEIIGCLPKFPSIVRALENVWFRVVQSNIATYVLR